MNLHEYQAKKLFRDYDISVSEGLPASSSQEAEKIALSLNLDKSLEKAQVHPRGRRNTPRHQLKNTIQKHKTKTDKFQKKIHK